mgnify:CR=1 FL=1
MSLNVIKGPPARAVRPPPRLLASARKCATEDYEMGWMLYVMNSKVEKF